MRQNSKVIASSRDARVGVCCGWAIRGSFRRGVGWPLSTPKPRNRHLGARRGRSLPRCPRRGWLWLWFGGVAPRLAPYLSRDLLGLRPRHRGGQGFMLRPPRGCGVLYLLSFCSSAPYLVAWMTWPILRASSVPYG